MTDSLQIAADTIKAVADTASAHSPENFEQLTFSFENIINGNGIYITIIGYVVVFVALWFLYFVFEQISKFLIKQTKKKLKSSGEEESGIEPDISGEVNAAIAMALHLYFEEAHDFENTVLTIKKVQRPYSPWSSKIYGLRQSPRN